MKKLLVLILTLALTVGLVACSSEGSSAEEKTWDSAQLETYLDTVLTSAAYSDDGYKEMVASGTQAMEITDDMKEYHLGSADYTYERAVIREPMMSSQAFSALMITTATPEEATALAAELETTVDPNKWVCVGVDPSDVKTATNGNLVFLIMANESQIFIDSFNAMVAE